jgi:ketosteroid isomerase-like protein
MTATTTDTDTTLAVVRQLEDAFNAHDVDAQLTCLTTDAVFEIVAPPDKMGIRLEGQDAIRGMWSGLPGIFPGYQFQTEDIFAVGNRCCYRWLLSFDLPDSGRAQLHGVDIYTIRDGKIAEKLTYFTA